MSKSMGMEKDSRIFAQAVSQKCINKKQREEKLDAGKILLFDMSHSFLGLMNRTKMHA